MKKRALKKKHKINVKNGHVEDIDFHPGISIDFHNKGGGVQIFWKGPMSKYTSKYLILYSNKQLEVGLFLLFQFSFE